MFKLTHLIKILLLIALSLFIISCEDTGDKLTLKEIAIQRIANYADGTGPEPTIRNYEDAGIIGVNEKNIDELNGFIETLGKEDIDTGEELNAVVDGLGVSLASDIFAPVITIHGPNPLTLFKGDTYKKVCATAIDNRDGEVTVYVLGDVDTSRIGTYIVKYSAVDEAGNLASVNRVIHVDEVPPEPNHFMHVKLLTPSALSDSSISVTLNSTDTLNILTTSSTFSTPLQNGTAYNVTLIETPLFSSFGHECQFLGLGGTGTMLSFIANPANGTMGSSDITLQINCPN